MSLLNKGINTGHNRKGITFVSRGNEIMLDKSKIFFKTLREKESTGPILD
jgi:hypothetical protein